MFDKIKNKINSAMSQMGQKNSEYVVDIQTFEQFIRQELQNALNNSIELSVHLYINFRYRKHNMYIWNYTASSFETERKKGVSINLDGIEYDDIDNLMNFGSLDGVVLADINEYFVVELIGYESDFLENFKFMHPELMVGDYK